MKSKAVSEIIASLIIIAIAASVGATLYVYSLDLFSSIRSNADLRISSAKERQLESFLVTYTHYDNSSRSLSIYVYSYGVLEVKIVDVYVDNEKYDVSKTINPSEIGNISITQIDLVSGIHSLTVVSERGNRYETYFRTS